MDRSWMPLASAALTCSAEADYARAGKACQALADQYGADLIPTILMAWIDTVLAQAGHKQGGKPSGVAWFIEETGEIRDADGMPPAARWAGRLFIARANNDEPQFRALIGSVASDEEWSRNVGAVLNSMGAQLRMLGWPSPVQEGEPTDG